MSEADTVPEDVKALVVDTYVKYVERTKSRIDRDPTEAELLAVATECIMADRAAWNRRAPIAEGMVMVPREPTEAMIDSLAKVMYFDQHSIMHDHNDHWRAANQGLYRSFARTAYRAMLAASTKEG